MQYPVQIKHFPGNIGQPSNYESMGNSYSLNKFDATQTNETNDSSKNLLNEGGSAGHRDVDIKPTTNKHVNNHVEIQLPTVAADAELAIENETNRK